MEWSLPANFDRRAVGFGVAVFAVALVVSYTTQYKGLVELWNRTGVQPSLLPWYVTYAVLSALGGMVAIHYSPYRTQQEAGAAGAVGAAVGLLLLSAINPTVQRGAGQMPYFNLTFTWFIIDLVVSTASAVVGGTWYLDWLRKQGK